MTLSSRQRKLTELMKSLIKSGNFRDDTVINTLDCISCSNVFSAKCWWSTLWVLLHQGCSGSPDSQKHVHLALCYLSIFPKLLIIIKNNEDKLCHVIIRIWRSVSEQHRLKSTDFCPTNIRSDSWCKSCITEAAVYSCKNSLWSSVWRDSLQLNLFCECPLVSI